MPDRRTFLRTLLGTTAALAVSGLWTAGCRREPADADNPGRWFFHCHNLYHLESGMAREVRYRA